MIRLPIRVVALSALALSGLSLSACGATSHSQAKNAGPVHVVYAGSLQNVNNLQIGPAFQKATHYPYQGQGGGSFGMAEEIMSHSIPANVFESVGYAPIQRLEPKQTTWALQFATSPLVIAYSPTSKFASQLNAIRDGKKPLRDLFLLMAQPSFHLGRTNPNTDPQGQAFTMMMELAQRQYNLPAHFAHTILGSLDNPHQVYSEEGILTLLQSGGLDASSAFLSEALERHLDYIPLPASLNFADPKDAGIYRQVSLQLSNHTVVRGTPLAIDITTVGHPTPGAVAFIRYVLGKSGTEAMHRDGYTTFSPTLQGSRNQLPQALAKLVL